MGKWPEHARAFAALSSPTYMDSICRGTEMPRRGRMEEDIAVKESTRGNQIGWYRGHHRHMLPTMFSE